MSVVLPSAAELKSPTAITASGTHRTGEELGGLGLLDVLGVLDLQVGVDEAERATLVGGVDGGPPAVEREDSPGRHGHRLLGGESSVPRSTNRGPASGR